MTAPDSKLPRIAVIGIHGVADQVPCDTAHAAADLLVRAEAARESGTSLIEGQAAPAGSYDSFHQRTLRIQVKPVETPESKAFRAKRDAAGTEKRFIDRLKEALSFRLESEVVGKRLQAAGASGAKSAAELSGAQDMSVAYMDEQLSAGVVPDSESTYETIRRDSVRTGQPAEVHVSEMYWADLSRPVGSVVRWLIEFYQLLFHLCSLGRKSLDFARTEYQSGAGKTSFRWRLWSVMGWAQRIAEDLLALFVPVLNLFLLGLGTALGPLLLQSAHVPWAFRAVLIALGILVPGFVLYFWREFFVRHARAWPVWFIPFLLVSGGAGALCWRAVEDIPNPLLWLMVAWWVVPLVGITWMMASYQRSRPGALSVALAIVVVATAFYAIELWYSHADGWAMLNALLRAAEWLLLLLQVCWLGIIVSALVATIAGFFVRRALPDYTDARKRERERDQARRAAWTTNLTLVVPALTVLILNLTLWWTLINAAVPAKSTTSPPSGERPAWSWNVVKNAPVWEATHTPLGSKDANAVKPPARESVRNLMKRSHTPIFAAVAGLFLLAALLLAWAILPAVLAEAGLTRARRRSPESEVGSSTWLGESLSGGFAAMRGSGEIVRLTLLVLLPIGTWLATTGRSPWLDFAELNNWFFLVGAWIVAGLVLSRGPLRGVALGLRGALDVALDVMNWLRLHPLSNNPRARICARYHSLFKHIYDWRDPRDGDGYKAIVILAHSQGTVITADLLRYLKVKGMNPRLPIYFFTMGCPLRQLYSLRFPHLYDWARHCNQEWAQREPLPETLGVKLWVNAYRSGDYVGRHVWRGDREEDLWSPVVVREGGVKRELCIGAGAHLKYWDASAPAVAAELDRLVTVAAASANAG